jgi:hypothetical protein
MWVGGQHHGPAALLREGSPVSIVQEAGWDPGSVWTGVENLALPQEFEPRTVQPVASAIPAFRSTDVEK